MDNEVFERESSSIVLSVLISGAIGAGLALLLTPKSGKEIRSDIGRLARKTGEEASDTYEESKAAVSQAVQSGKQSISGSSSQLSDITSESQGRSLVVPILVSGVIGAAVALLFAPKAGKEVVEDIKDLASSAIEKGKGYYEQGSSALKEAMEKGKEAAAETKEKLRPAA